VDTERPGPKLIKKLFVLSALVGLIVSQAGSTPAHDDNKAPQPGEKIERSLPVDAQVTVTLCVASGTLTVHGWEKNEVRVRSLGAGQLDFRRIDKTKDSSKPATRVDVMVMQRTGVRNAALDCQALADVEMEVPSGATVQVQTRDGDISISGVAAAYAGSQNGDITIERATKLVEAGSVGGSIILKDSSGRVNLSSAGGGVEAVNIRPVTPEDTFEVGTVSGDIQLDRVGNFKVNAKTVNGTVTMTGPLAKSGYYGFTNMAGDLVLALPHDASFQLNAKVSEKQSIISDFKLTFINEPPARPAPAVTPKVPVVKDKPEVKDKAAVKDKPATKGGPVIATIPAERPIVIAPAYSLKRVNAICGSGDATISVASFGGTVRLKKI
jgi:putative adhesin